MDYSGEKTNTLAAAITVGVLFTYYSLKYTFFHTPTKKKDTPKKHKKPFFNKGVKKSDVKELVTKIHTTNQKIEVIN